MANSQRLKKESRRTLFLLQVFAEELPDFGGGVHILFRPRVFASDDLIEPHLVAIYASYIAVCNDLIAEYGQLLCNLVSTAVCSGVFAPLFVRSVRSVKSAILFVDPSVAA